MVTTTKAKFIWHKDLYTAQVDFSLSDRQTFTFSNKIKIAVYIYWGVFINFLVTNLNTENIN